MSDTASARPGAGFLAAAAGLLVVAFLLRWGLAVAVPSTARADEIFQTLEPAFRFWSGEGIVTWEWREGVRSVLFPGFLSGLMSVAGWLGWGAGGYLALIAGVLSLVSLAPVAAAMWFGWRQGGPGGAILCAAIPAFWPDLVWLGPKTLTEVQAGNLLIIGVCLAAWLVAPERRGPSHPATVALLGFLLALSTVLRTPLGPAALLVAAWACRTGGREWVALCCGGAVPVLMLGATDALAWGVPFASVWRHLSVNLGEGVMHDYGEPAPVHWYLQRLMLDWGAVLAPFLLLFFRGAPLAPLPAATALAVLVTHSAISHKETSFIYAALPPALVVVGLGTLRLVDWLATSLRPGTATRPALLAHATMLWVLTAGATAAGGGFRPNWTQQSNFLLATAELRRHDDLCGLVLYGDRTHWASTGGNAWIGRGIPFYLARSPAMLAEVGHAANFAMTDPASLGQMPGFRPLGCLTGSDRQGQVCLARTEATSCTASGLHQLNSNRYLGRRAPEE